MSRDNMAKFFDISKRGLLNIIDKIVALGFVERDEHTKYLKTTQLWFDEIVEKRRGAENAPTVQNRPYKSGKSGAKIAPNGAKIAPNGAKIAPNSNIDNHIDKYVFISYDVKNSFKLYILDRIAKKEKITESTILFAYKHLQKL
jgi:hypothetical protein